jgi:hypothetical protein
MLSKILKKLWVSFSIIPVLTGSSGAVNPSKKSPVHIGHYLIETAADAQSIPGYVKYVFSASTLSRREFLNVSFQKLAFPSPEQLTMTPKTDMVITVGIVPTSIMQEALAAADKYKAGIIQVVQK